MGRIGRGQGRGLASPHLARDVASRGLRSTAWRACENEVSIRAVQDVELGDRCNDGLDDNVMRYLLDLLFQLRQHFSLSSWIVHH